MNQKSNKLQAKDLVTVGIFTALIAGIAAELCRKSLGYDTATGNLVSYAVFSLGMVGNLLPVWMFRDSFLANMAGRVCPALRGQRLRCLSGLQKESAGTILYEGSPLNRRQRNKLCYMIMQDVNHQLFRRVCLG